MKAGFILFVSLALFLSFASSSTPFEELKRNVKGVVHVAEEFVTKFTSKNYHALVNAHGARSAKMPPHQRQRHIMIGKKHIDTNVEPSFEKNEYYKVHKSHGEAEDLHEYYINLKKADYKAVLKIESDFGWERTVNAKGTKKGRLSSYIPHNTFVFVGTEEEALKLQDHELVHWVGARDPLDKLSGTFARHPEDREKWSKLQDELHDSFKHNLEVRLHFHSKINTQEHVDEIVSDIHSILDHINIKTTITSQIKKDNEFIAVITCETTADTHMVALRLAPLPSVHYVDQPPIARTYNDLANQWVETGAIDEDAMGGANDDYVDDRSNSLLSFLDGSEDGTTYLVGLADTGIDWDNCMFFDSSNSVPFNRVNMDHRTIVSYDTTYGDRMDGVFHGTHMAGTLAGNERRVTSYPIPEGTLNGLVPDAKLVFADLAEGGSEDVTLPANLGELFDITYDVGAKVNVYGWGTRILTADGTDFYNELDFRTDEYVMENNDFMAFFPTGNRQYERFPLVVSSPAASKNAFAVSTTRGFHESLSRWYGRTGEEFRYLFNFFHRQICSDSVFWWNDPAFCASFDLNSPCQSFQNTLICPNFNTPSDCCRFSYFEPLCCESYFQENLNTTANPENSVSSSVLFNEYILDGQGNHGPMFDGRYGVDMVFPGTGIVSANSDQNTGSRNCGTNNGVKVLNGTSMSAAVGGGAAVKVVQYLEQGYYPFGDKTRSNAEPFSPSTSLVKALMMASTVSMRTINGNQRQYYFDSHDTAVPNNYEGMGAPVLARTLHVYTPPTDTENDVDVFPYGLRRIAIGRSTSDPNHLYLNTDGRYRGCFRTGLDARHFSVTLVWNDPPANLNSAFALVNNLDLVVTTLLGDSVSSSVSSISYDSRNNFEQVRFDANLFSQINYSPCGSSPVNNCIYQQYAFSIKADPLISEPASLPFSLVVHAWNVDTAGNELPVQVIDLGQTGDSFNGLGIDCEAENGINSDIGQASICPRNCSGYGECNSAGFCDCFQGYRGLDCSLSICNDDCNNNGFCNGETGSCECSEDWTGVNCLVFDPVVPANVSYVPSNCSCECDNDIAVGAAAGIGVGGFFLGLMLGGVLGAVIGIKWLIARKRRKVAELKQKLAARENMAGGGNAGVDPDGP